MLFLGAPIDILKSNLKVYQFTLWKFMAHAHLCQSCPGLAASSVIFIPTASLKRLALGAFDRTKERALAPALLKFYWTRV